MKISNSYKKFISIFLVTLTFSAFAFSAEDTEIGSGQEIQSNSYFSNVQNEVAIGGGYLFYYETADYNNIDFDSFLHNLTVNFSYRFFETKNSKLGFAYNMDFGFPVALDSVFNKHKTNMTISNCNLQGFVIDNAFGFQMRHDFTSEHAIECFAGVLIDTIYMEYSASSTAESRTKLFDFACGLQARCAYVYHFNDFISISAGLDISFEFYPYAQIVYPDMYSNFYIVEAAPIVMAVMKF